MEYQYHSRIDYSEKSRIMIIIYKLIFIVSNEPNQRKIPTHHRHDVSF